MILLNSVTCTHYLYEIYLFSWLDVNTGCLKINQNYSKVIDITDQSFHVQVHVDMLMYIQCD